MKKETKYKGFVCYTDANGNLRVFKPGKGRKPSNKTIYPGGIKDITSQFKKEKKENTSILEIEGGVNRKKSKAEISGALWYLKKKGGRIKVLKEKTTRENKGKLNPDYLHNNKELGDWKESETATFKAVRRLVKKGANQIKVLPGLVVIDVSNIDMSDSEIFSAVKDGMRDNSTHKFKVVVKKGDKIVKVYQKK